MPMTKRRTSRRLVTRTTSRRVEPNAGRRPKKRRTSRSSIDLGPIAMDGFSLRHSTRGWEAWVLPDDPERRNAVFGKTAKEAADALMVQEGRELKPWNYLDREQYESNQPEELPGGVWMAEGGSVRQVANSRRRTPSEQMAYQHEHIRGAYRDQVPEGPSWMDTPHAPHHPGLKDQASRQIEWLRPLRANVIPPAPEPGSADFADWFRKTFSEGTRVRFTGEVYGDDSSGNTTLVPAGSKGEVYVNDMGRRQVGVSVELSEPSFFSVTTKTVTVALGWFALSQRAEPLDDNWGDPPKPLKRRQLPPSQRGVPMKHRRLAPNVIPPPPSGREDFLRWLWKTFAPGTGVRLTREHLGHDRTSDDKVTIPAGTIGDVRFIELDPSAIVVRFVLHDPMLFSSTTRTVDADVSFGEARTGGLVPLDDNWGDPPKPLKRRQLPPSQRGVPMKHRRLAPNRRTSRRPR